MNKELNDRLNKINSEDNFFVIFIILIILSYIANQFEKSYLINEVEKDQVSYYYLQVFIFFVVVIINLYYVYSSYNGVKSSLMSNDLKQIKYETLIFVSSLFALVAGILILYVAVNDTEIDAEISL